MIAPVRIIFPIVVLLLPPALSAQLFGPAGGSQGGGTFGDCDTTLALDLTVEPLGGLQQQFTALIDAPDHSVLDVIWTYHTGELQQENGTVIQPIYPSAGETPVCLTVNAIDLSSSMPCSSTTCRFVEILPDPSCLAYDPDFSIVGVNGQTVSFEVEGPIPDTASLFWDLGDGAVAITSSAQGTFEGPGPHRICLTMTGPDPINCTSTICKWLYLGPGELPCEEILEPGFVHFQSDNIVVVLDTSHTTGQNSTVHWDLGDGTTAEGKVAFHIYQPWDMVYEICSTVDLSGPLATQGCSSTQCKVLTVGVSAASVGEHGTFPIGISPNPAHERISVTDLPQGRTRIELIDALGRPVLVRNAENTAGTLSLSLEGISPGIYVVRCLSGERMALGRFVKQ